MGNKKHATCFATLLQNKLNNNVAHFTCTHIKPVLQQNKSGCLTGLMWVVKCATSLFNLFCSNVARQVARFLLPVFLYLKREFLFNNVWYNFLFLQLSDREGAWLFCSFLRSHAGLGKCCKDWQA